MPLRAVVFDLDGTLLDTLADIGDAVNHALAAAGLPAHPPDAYRRFVGEGAERLIARAVPADRAELVPRVLETFLARYGERLVVATRPYPGVPELLDTLAARGVPMAVFSNKPDAKTRRLVDGLLGRWRFAAVHGNKAGVPRKPDPTVALAIAAELGLPAADFAFAGDSGVDMETARGAGMVPVGVTWGFRDREELAAAGAAHVIERPDELLPLLS